MASASDANSNNNDPFSTPLTPTSFLGQENLGAGDLHTSDDSPTSQASTTRNPAGLHRGRNSLAGGGHATHESALGDEWHALKPGSGLTGNHSSVGAYTLAQPRQHRSDLLRDPHRDGQSRDLLQTASGGLPTAPGSHPPMANTPTRHSSGFNQNRTFKSQQTREEQGGTDHQYRELQERLLDAENRHAREIDAMKRQQADMFKLLDRRLAKLTVQQDELQPTADHEDRRGARDPPYRPDSTSHPMRSPAKETEWQFRRPTNLAPAFTRPPPTPLYRPQANDFQPAHTSVITGELITKAIIGSITRYNGKNYEQWAEEMHRVFVLEGKVQHLERDCSDDLDPITRMEDLRLASFLDAHIEPGFKRMIRRDGPGAFHLWNALLEMHGYESKNKTEDTVLRLINNAMSGPRTSLQAYLDTQTAHMYELLRRKATFDEIMSAVIMAGIPPQYAYLKAQVRHLDVSCEEKIRMLRRMQDPQRSSRPQASTSKVYGLTTKEEKRKGYRIRRGFSDTDATESDAASRESETFRATRRKTSKSDKKSGACFRCKRRGHWIAECKEKGHVYAICDECFVMDESDQPTESEEERRDVCLVTGLITGASGASESDDSETELECPAVRTINRVIVNQIVATNCKGEPTNRNVWVFDTGSSVNVCNSLGWFTKYRPVSVKFGTSSDKGSLAAEAIGTVQFRLRCGRKFVVDNVYYCPTARMNLMTNLGLRREFTFTVAPDQIIANYTDRHSGRSQSFEFAHLHEKQNVILVGRPPREVINAVQRRSSSRANSDRRERSATPESDRESDLVQAAVAGKDQPAERRGPGRPRKHQQPPPKEMGRDLRVGLDPQANDQSDAETNPCPGQLDDSSVHSSSSQESESESEPAPTPEKSGKNLRREKKPPDPVPGGAPMVEHDLLDPDSGSDSEEPARHERPSLDRKRRYQKALRRQMKKLAKMNGVKDVRQIHRLYGHIGKNATSEMSYLFGVPCHNFDCEPCQISNLQPAVGPSKSFRKSTRPLDIVYMDICQPYQRKVKGYKQAKYALVMLDDYTGYAQVAILKSKSEEEVFAAFEKFRLAAETKFNCKLAELRTDNGKEFDNSSFKKWAAAGPRHGFSVAHVHQMNGRIERLNQSLERRCHRLIETSGLSEYYWPLAMKRAAELFNNTANPRHGVPYFNWHGHVDGHMLYEFGERVAFLYYDSKGERQRAKGRIVGQDDDSRSYQIIPAGSNRILNRVYFVKRLRRFPDSPLEPIVAGLSAEPTEEVYLEYYNQVAADLHESRERSERTEMLDRFVLQLIDQTPTPPATTRVPEHYADIKRMDASEQDYWHECVRTEINTLIEKGVFKPVLRAEATSKPIDTRCVFTMKEGTGKARLVARGDKQAEDTYFDTYSPTMNIDILRMLLKLALEMDLEVVTFDVKRAYLNAVLKEDVYVNVPEGFHLTDQDIDRSKYVLKLERALYGLKQSGKAWYDELSTTLKASGFVPLDREPTVFYHPNKLIFIAVYVDDLLVLAESADQVNFVRDKLLRKYELHEGGDIRGILGLNITKRPDGFAIDLTTMIDELCTSHEIRPDARVFTPLAANDVIDARPDGVKFDYFEYAGLLGSLLYIARMTRPDILAAVVQMCQFQSAPRRYHFRRLLNILRYLANTRDYVYLVRKDGSLELSVFADSSLANCHDRRFLMGCAVYIGDAMISYSSRKSRAVALSSNEAEIMASVVAMREVMYNRRFLCSIAHPPVGEESEGCPKCIVPPLFVDNAGVLSFAERGFSRRTRYLDIEYYAIKAAVDHREIDLRYVPSADNRADLFTKNLSADALAVQRQRAGLIPVTVSAAH